jgi:hypothetical protein
LPVRRRRGRLGRSISTTLTSRPTPACRDRWTVGRETASDSDGV